jgi:outer membrane protein assembly factor BamB
MRRITQLAVVVAWVGSIASLSRADDWPQWLGPGRDSVWHETGVLEKFPAGGPRVLWRTPIAGGYAGPAVAGDRVFVTDYVRSAGDASNNPNGRNSLTGQERVLCLDAASGKVLWKREYDCPYSISYPAGPRATPTVDGEHVYTLGAEGNLRCLRVDSGEVVWQVDFKQAYKAPTPVWGFCSHPLVDGDRLVCLVGGPGSIAVAFDKRTGKELWRALSATDAGYSSPMIVEHSGRRQLVVWHPQAVNGLDPQSGQLFWSVPLEPNYGMSIISPRQAGPYLFVGGIVNVGVMLKLTSDKPAVEEVWRTSAQRGLGPVHSSPVPVGDVLYGVNRDGELTAVQIASGERLWQTYAATTGGRRANSATAYLVRNGERFCIMSETGELIIARLSPEKYEELDRAKILEPTNEAFGRRVVWSHPAFAHRAIFARNDQEIVCVSLATESP